MGKWVNPSHNFCNFLYNLQVDKVFSNCTLLLHWNICIYLKKKEANSRFSESILLLWQIQEILHFLTLVKVKMRLLEGNRFKLPDNSLIKSPSSINTTTTMTNSTIPVKTAVDFSICTQWQHKNGQIAYIVHTTWLKCLSFPKYRNFKTCFCLVYK